MLDRVSPIDGDCGLLCGSACCTCGAKEALEASIKCSGESDETCGEEEFELGIYLYPGEDLMFKQDEDWLEWSYGRAEDYDFPDSWIGRVYFVRCKTPPVCPREIRPLQCRFYPLAPHLDEDGVLHLILSDLETPYTCPLITENIKLQPRFIKATYTVWKHLIKDPLIYDLVEMDSDYRMEDDKPLQYIEESLTDAG